MRRALRSAAMFAGIFAAFAAVAQAGQEVPVGRVDVVLQDDKWQVYSLNDTGNAVSGSESAYKQSADTKVLIHGAADHTIGVVLIVRANISGKGRRSAGLIYPNARCEGSSSVFAEGDEPGPAARSFRCLRVLPPGDVTGPNGVQSDIKEMLAKDGWTWPQAMHVIMTSQHAYTGSFAGITALVSAEAMQAFAEKASDKPESLPEGISAASVQWGRHLQEAVSDSVYSIRGKLPVPELRLAGSTDR